MKSGTFEALLYEELSELGAQGRYANVMGYVNSAEVTCVFLATASAGPLYALGGYALVGWVSIAITVVDGLLVFTLPSAPSEGERGQHRPVRGDESFLARYAQALRDGTGGRSAPTGSSGARCCSPRC